jgi:hypothetical protein
MTPLFHKLAPFLPLHGACRTGMERLLISLRYGDTNAEFFSA